MIDKNMEPYYDILLSIFMGIFLILLFHNIYDCPRTIIFNSNIPLQTKTSCSKINL